MCTDQPQHTATLPSLTTLPHHSPLLTPPSSALLYLPPPLASCAYLQGPLLHIDIAEEEKPSLAELGAALYIGRTDREKGELFDDLDEIVARYVEPVRERGAAQPSQPRRRTSSNTYITHTTHTISLSLLPPLPNTARRELP